MSRIIQMIVLIICMFGMLFISSISAIAGANSSLKKSAVKSKSPVPANRGQLRNISFSQLQKEFEKPDRIYSPFIFWFWDEPLNTKKMAEMAKVMASEGFNPGYAHARMSMIGTPSLPDDQWLGDKWFDAFSASLKSSEAQKSYLGYCDEYWWPSFQAHGRIIKNNPELQAQSLSWEVMDIKGGSVIQIPESFTSVAGKLVDPMVNPLPINFLSRAHWIWHPDGGPTAHSCWFRTTFQLPATRTISKATITLTADNSYSLFINGKDIGQANNWYTPDTYDVTSILKPGDNLIAVEGKNIDGPCGLLASLTVMTADGAMTVINSDKSWMTSLKSVAGWEKSEQSVTGWVPAREIAAANEGPWQGGLTTAGDHPRAAIRSSSLMIIGSGPAFTWNVPEGDSWRVYIFNKYHHSGIDGGQTNSIDERLAGAFIDTALEPYAKRMGKKMGRSIPGDFIDNEGDYGWKLAWSDTLDKRYQKKYGMDIRLWLPLLIDPDAEGKYASARWRWFDLVSDLYSENFRAVTDWHEKRGMYTTAHVWEEGIPAQVNAVGDHLKFLRAITMPGQDCLGAKALLVHDFKEAVSTAAFQNSRSMTELMGAGAASGPAWGTFNPVFLKQAINAVGAWGIGHIIPHGVFATRTLTGNPWPPDWYNENPMYPWLHLWNSFSARTSLVNSVGQAAPDVLLYNPMESAWIMTTSDNLDTDLWKFPDRDPDGHRVNELDRVYSETINSLTDARVEFLIGDRFYMNQMVVSSGRLVRGGFSFKTLVLPPLRILTLDTAQKMVQFAKSGGNVYALGTLPDSSAENGAGDPLMIDLMTTLSQQPSFHSCSVEGSLKIALSSSSAGLESPVKFLSGNFPMLQQHRKIDGRDFFWLVNNNETTQSCELQIEGAHGTCSIWDCETGSSRPVASVDSPSGSRLSLNFKTLEAFWLVFDTKEHAVSNITQNTDYSQILSIDGPWMVRYDPKIQPVMEFPVKPDTSLITGFVKPLEDWKNWGDQKFSGLMDYTNSFVYDGIAQKVILDLGKVCHAAEVTVNGKSCGKRLWGPYTFDISYALKPGVNTLKIRIANLINNSYGDIQESGLFGPVILGE